MKKLLFTSLLILVGFVFTTNIFSQSTGDYRSAATGNWNVAATWETYNGSAWVAAGSAPTGSETITIQSAHVVLIVSSVSISTGYVKNQYSSVTTQATAASTTTAGSTTITLSASNASIAIGQLVTCSVEGSIPLGTTVTAISGTSLTISQATTVDIAASSTLTFSTGLFLGTGGSLSFGNGSTYEHAGNGGPIPTATWSTGSTCKVTGVTANSPSNANQNFANFIWDCTGQTAGLNLGWSGNTISGTITCNNTNGNQFRWTSNLANGGSAITITINGNIVVNNAAIMSPTSSGAAQVYTIDQTGNISVNGTGQLYVCGTSNTGAFVTWNITGNIFAAPACSLRSSNSISRWKFNSGGTQTMDIGASNVIVSNVIWEVANGTTVQLISPVTIARLVLTSGKINSTSTYLLTIGSTNSVTGGSLTAYVEGPMAHQYNLVGTQSFIYPIAKDGIYRPLTLSLTQGATTTSTYTAEMFNAAPPANSLPGPGTLDKVSSVRYYTISEGAGGSAFTAGAVTLSYGADDGVTDAPNLRIAKDDGAGNWVDLGGSGASPITSTNTFSSLSVFALANATGGTNPLPVELTSFTAAAKDGVVELTWTTATETNNYGWDIEMRKNSETSWERIGFISGAGNSNSTKKYSFVDKSANQSDSYSYRLKQIDADGKFSYSKEVTVKVETPITYSLGQNYPNPFNPSTNIDYTLPADSKVTLAIYSLIGEKVADLVNEEQASGYYSYQFSSRALNLTSGIYLYKLTAVSKSNEVFSQSRKMLLLK